MSLADELEKLAGEWPCMAASVAIATLLRANKDTILSALREREAVVAMLQQPPDKVFGHAEGYCDLIDGTGGGHEGVVRDLRMFLRFFARAIEAGEHMKGEG